MYVAEEKYQHNILTIKMKIGKVIEFLFKNYLVCTFYGYNLLHTTLLKRMNCQM